MFQNLAAKEPGDAVINIGAVLRVTPIKDVKTMINAFHFAKEKVTNLKLYIMGNTEEDKLYYNECVELVGMLGTQDVVFTGQVNVRDYLGKMDIILLTSISEGQPLSIMEAMAAEKVCVATNVGDCYDMLNAGDDEYSCGIVVPVMNVGKIAQSIIKLAEDPDLRKRMGDNGKKAVIEKYQDTIFLNRYDEIYNETYHNYLERISMKIT
jgi:glycosyltransferase involved in cell wall biosynthesis